MSNIIASGIVEKIMEDLKDKYKLKMEKEDEQKLTVRLYVIINKQMGYRKRVGHEKMG